MRFKFINLKTIVRLNNTCLFSEFLNFKNSENRQVLIGTPDKSEKDKNPHKNAPLFHTKN
jgi:hypothetical protein